MASENARAAALDRDVDRAIEMCGGDARAAIRALIVLNDLLWAQCREYATAVSGGYARGKLPDVQRLERDMEMLEFFRRSQGDPA